MQLVPSRFPDRERTSELEEGIEGGRGGRAGGVVRERGGGVTSCRLSKDSRVYAQQDRKGLQRSVVKEPAHQKDRFQHGVFEMLTFMSV